MNSRNAGKNRKAWNNFQKNKTLIVFKIFQQFFKFLAFSNSDTHCHLLTKHPFLKHLLLAPKTERKALPERKCLVFPNCDARAEKLL